MNIRTKLTLTFFTIVIFIVSLISLSIYYFSENHRENDFFRRLRVRAANTARLLTKFKQIDDELIKIMQKDNPANLPNQNVMIFDLAGKEIYNSLETSTVRVDKALRERIVKEGLVQFTSGHDQVIGFVFNDAEPNIIVVASATDLYGYEAVGNLKKILFTTFAISIGIVSFSGWFYSGKVLRPISKMINDIDNISETNLDLRLNEGNKKDELGKLSKRFNRMLDRLESAFISQKHFIANASHELKTPITALTGQIEVTLQKERTNEYYIQTFLSVLNGLRNLNSLTSQLLLLAQTSTTNAEKRFSAVRIDETLWEVKDELIKAFPHYKINILFDQDLNDDSLVIQGDEQLIRILLLNLADNGCKYSNNYEVAILLKSYGQAVSVEFENRGHGIDPDEIKYIFSPFYRGKNTKNVKGFGIGLSLVSRIAALHGGQISVESIPGEITKLVVYFPSNHR
ncbi:MAG TPA: ATP-binding protein [Chryseosolibacter sp.]|nr:ATP-binding protein [Chryseosolibacter sp.]